VGLGLETTRSARMEKSLGTDRNVDRNSEFMTPFWGLLWVGMDSKV
jgi:hypothetical protein